MTSLSEFNSYGEELERKFSLRTSPIAVKMLKDGEDIPNGAIRPSRDLGHPIAQCQAFALSAGKTRPLPCLRRIITALRH
jgi:uncharacterized protein (DUF169 family)